MNKKILVTGGTGYIGSHTVVELLDRGYQVVVVDNLSNSKLSVVDRVKTITGKDFDFYEIDLLDKEKLEKIFQEHNIDAVIHFAGLKAVGESVQKPLAYYHNNLLSTLNLLELMQEYQVYDFVFSSSATVYGMSNIPPFAEDLPLSTTNPYGATKLIIEGILVDLQKADNNFNIICLRYFNPVGAHSSGMIGEDPQGIPNNLMPFVGQVGSGKLAKLSIFGGDYDTQDGTCIRDYIHVVDLAIGHILALEHISKVKPAWRAYNLGSGNGCSVLEIVTAYEKALGKKIPYQIVDRRAGDIAEMYANATKAKQELGFETKKTIDDICVDIVRWQNYAKENDI
ncbi:UDP-glucose 4-epimerase GalE [Francisella philomiragia]|uniref:UDP-glucose 4-epimerase GalE n=1 Tax=Francisella philomiragia TaxID=28110 RepID=UPI001908B932|nr:UDP-glucose 4-epimerase GalE [Francisella philomiragia]MBK2093355.1 UDP-glucose 4-epimerase GalE [Francisella philomiragia]MBK2255826.1 UDP-glucose 4-epimerase GalE [Francisella philomiragia]MBK2268484.1 UDP-glucose 4-epimerase GalE [Francisella philomiragia]MBK2271041.1 UDP-glucose 4-epimerase GalE [Francisella philomiragia]MBK2274821.1 UDP-glucose 4-epimerase GalE [Francisella philomiragia]